MARIKSGLVVFGLASFCTGCNRTDLQAENRQLRQALRQKDAQFAELQDEMTREINDRMNKIVELMKAKNACEAQLSSSAARTQTETVRRVPKKF